MVEQNEQETKMSWVIPLVVLAIVIAGAIVWRLTRQEPAAQEVATAVPEINAVTEANGLVVLPPSKEKPPIIVEKPQPPALDASIQQIINTRKYWDPAFMQWVGKKAPDFELSDINGKVHKLSDYRGKPVILVFWATWCGPCKQEIPGLVELRKEMPEDKLAILAISYEQGATVREFLAQMPVNYTIIATPQNIMPPPYSEINGIPASFFIDKNGVIRLGSEGLILPAEDKMILKAIE